jgi:hypothetical protein
MGARTAVLLAAAALALGCGGSSGPDRLGPDAAAEAAAAVAGEDEPCLLADADAVAGAFGASAGTAEPGSTMTGDPLCEYRFQGGVVPAVYVQHRGSSDGWDSFRQEFTQANDVVREVPGIGDEALYLRGRLYVMVAVRSGPIHVTALVPLAEVRPGTGAEVDAALEAVGALIAGD